MKCQKKGCFHIGVEEHHIHPRFMNNFKGDGKKIPLCKKHHDILHKTIPSIIWRYVQDGFKFSSWKTKTYCINAVIKFTEDWLVED